MCAVEHSWEVTLRYREAWKRGRREGGSRPRLLVVCSLESLDKPEPISYVIVVSERAREETCGFLLGLLAWRSPTAREPVDVTVLGLVGGAPGGETPRVADSSAAGAGRFFHTSFVC